MPTTGEGWKVSITRSGMSPTIPTSSHTAVHPIKKDHMLQLSTRIDEVRRRRTGLVRDYSTISHPRSSKDRVEPPPSSISPNSSTRELSMLSITHPDSTNISNNDKNRSPPHKELSQRPPNEVSSAIVSNQTSRTTASSLSDSQVELNEIQQSVQRLRAQRTHVEHLKQQNTRLELLVSKQKQEIERLRQEVAALRGVEQENVGLLQSFKLLEERIQNLEDMCQEKRQEVKTVKEEFSLVEHERDQLLLSVDELQVDHETQMKAYQLELSKVKDQLTRVERERDDFKSRHRDLEAEWHRKLESVHQVNQQNAESYQQNLVQTRKEKKKLVNEVEVLEQQVKKLLATTVRQTSMIEDCDRVLSEARAQKQTANENYHDQIQLNGQLTDQIQRLEKELSALRLAAESDRILWEKKIMVLESKQTKHKDRLEMLQSVLQEKEKNIQEFLRENLIRDHNSFHAEELNKELQLREKKLLSEVSTLQIALGDLTDEKNILSDQILDLQEQLENERKDRSRWATARLKLLAEFCDEENKLSSALHQSMPFEELNHETQSGSDEDIARRHNSIIFG